MRHSLRSPVCLSWVVRACAGLARTRLLRGGVCVCGSDANEVNVRCYALGSMSLNRPVALMYLASAIAISGCPSSVCIIIGLRNLLACWASAQFPRLLRTFRFILCRFWDFILEYVGPEVVNPVAIWHTFQNRSPRDNDNTSHIEDLLASHQRLAGLENKDDALRVRKSGQIKSLVKSPCGHGTYLDTMEERSELGQDFQEYGDRHVGQKDTTRTRKVETPSEETSSSTPAMPVSVP